MGAEWKNATEISVRDALYPAPWKGLSDAPSAIFAVGNTALLQERLFTVVGSRRTPANALKIGAQIAKELSNAFAIVTGTADGGDAAAIEGALAGSGKVVCLVAGGFAALPQGNLSFLNRVAERGLVLSPYPYETPVRSFSYEYRNKLLASLGEGTLVLGAAKKSGALITAKYAERFEKPIFALPYAPGSAAGEGCNRLIKQGGYLTENVKDVLTVFGIEKTESAPSLVLSEEEQKMYDVLRELSEGHIGEISAKAGVPVFKARFLLSALEVKGLTVALGGNRYAVLKV